jgi:5'-3' exonuclease
LEVVDVYLIDGTYELFRHFFGRPRSGGDGDGSRGPVEVGDVAAVRGVLWSIFPMLARGNRYMGIATDRVIESFRNDLWPGYKTGAGVDPALLAQFPLFEEAVEALGMKLWPMVELEADDALASAAAVAADDDQVERVYICTPDKDLSQCVRGGRVVSLDRRSGTIRDEDGVRERFGVSPESIPDWLALVGDSADGFPGIAGWGEKGSAAVLRHYLHLESIPEAARDWDDAVRRGVRGAERLAAALAAGRENAYLFRTLATLRVDRSLLAGGVEELHWRGPTPEFDDFCDKRLGDSDLAERARSLIRA